MMPETTLIGLEIAIQDPGGFPEVSQVRTEVTSEVGNCLPNDSISKSKPDS